MQEALRSSLHILDLAPDHIVFPVYAALWRSVLPKVYFSLFDVGPTGVLKSELAALLQQHFGAGFHGKNLPGSFLSTENALEMLAFTMKDALVVVDDFAPSGVKYDLQKQNKIAERLFRGQGNHSARQRCRQDGSMRPPKPSRGLPLGTGEDTPSMPSIRARLVIVEVSNGDISIELLSDCQNDGRNGIYAAAMAGYLKWLASRYAKIGERIEEEMRLLADDFRQASGHLRTADNAASLMLGFQYFMEFALDVGAIDARQHETYLTKAKAALLRNATTLTENQKANDPISRFFVYLRALLSSGKAHVADMEGNAPTSPGQWGWRRQVNDGMGNASDRWHQQGPRIGNVDGEDLYLNWAATFIAVNEYADKTGYGIGVTEQTLLKRLHEVGHLKSTEGKRGLRVRRNIEGHPRLAVVHISSNLAPPSQNLPNLPNRPTSADNGSSDWTCDGENGQGNLPKSEKPAHRTGPASQGTTGTSGDAGQDGQVGQLFEPPGGNGKKKNGIEPEQPSGEVDQAQQEAFEEQAAKLEYEGGLTREEAEQKARRQLNMNDNSRKEN